MYQEQNSNASCFSEKDDAFDSMSPSIGRMRDGLENRGTDETYCSEVRVEE